MNYYKHYIGDFQRDTSHLSLTERGAYLALIHHYYATEKPLPDDHGALCRIAGAMTKDERNAVKVAMKFFESMGSGLVHARIEAEIQKAEKRADTNREIALEREAKRKAERIEHESSTNRATERATSRNTKTAPYQEPYTNVSPSGETNNGAAAPDLADDTDFESLWAAFDGRYGEKGSKKSAAAAFRKLKPDKTLFSAMLSAVRAQTANRDQAAIANVFRANFQHVERWIKNQRWNDEIIPIPAISQRPTRSSPDRAAAAADEAFGPQSRVFEGDFDRVDSHGPADEPERGCVSHVG